MPVRVRVVLLETAAYGRVHIKWCFCAFSGFGVIVVLQGIDAILGADNMCPGIKDMPTYDPDGEVCSLALTIPSWISSIDRTQSVSDFEKVSESAGAKLIYELDHLVYAVQGIRSKLVKEVYHGRS